MWECPWCERVFKSKNQSHSCSRKSLDEFFEGKPSELLLAFDNILATVIDWDPCHVGPATNAIVFTKKKAWMIIRPMTKQLDIKVYFEEVLRRKVVHKVGKAYGRKIPHHVRIDSEHQVTEDLILFLREAWEASD